MSLIPCIFFFILFILIQLYYMMILNFIRVSCYQCRRWYYRRILVFFLSNIPNSFIFILFLMYFLSLSHSLSFSFHLSVLRSVCLVFSIFISLVSRIHNSFLFYLIYLVLEALFPQMTSFTNKKKNSHFSLSSTPHLCIYFHLSNYQINLQV